MTLRTEATQYLKVEGSLLKLTHLNKIFYPTTGFKKKDVLHYYRQIASTVLPYLRDRPFTFLRFPNGVDQASFYQKQCPAGHPSWIGTKMLHTTNHCLINGKASLLWAVNLGAIELHTTLGKTPRLERPTSLVLDLDPGEGTDLRVCAELALEIKNWLKPYRLELFPKTSGKKGLHLFIPLNVSISYDETQCFAKRIALKMEKIHGDWVISKMSKNLRSGKVFIDWSQNNDTKTTCTAYSLRANSVPTVSTPLHWKEVLAIARRQSEANRFLKMQQDDVLARIKKRGDLFSPVLHLKQSLPNQEPDG